MITAYMMPVFNDWPFIGGVSTRTQWQQYAMPTKAIEIEYPEWVFITLDISRDGLPSVDYLVTLSDAADSSIIAIYAPNLPATQIFERNTVYKELLAQAFDFSQPKLGAARWPVISETINTIRFALFEGEGGAQIPTVAATARVAARVDGLAAVREVAFVERMSDGQWRAAGSAFTAADRHVVADLTVTQTGDIFAVGIDDYGVLFWPLLDVSVGDRIRPSVFNGWLYRVTEAGQLPATEPAWWPAEGENAPRRVGTARLQAIRYYQPLAHGPIRYELA